MAYNFLDVVFSLKGLNPTDKLVLLHLAEHADKDTGECWPGYGRLADFTGLTRRSVIYAIKRLAELEFITVNPPKDDRKTNTYVVRMDKLVAASVATPAKKAKRKYTRKSEPSVDIESFFTRTTWPSGPNKGRDCIFCAKCGFTFSMEHYMLTHLEEKHPDLLAQVSTTKQEIEFLDENKTTGFCIEDEDDDLT